MLLPCEIGETLGRFWLDNVIGRGGMGVVYAATDISNGERVTRLIFVGCDRERHYMAMELVEGTDLAKWLKKESSARA